jgi:hypothetical protein
MSEPEPAPRAAPRVTPEMLRSLQAIRPWALLLALCLLAVAGVLAAVRPAAPGWPGPLLRVAVLAAVALVVLAVRSALILSGLGGAPDGWLLRSALAALLTPVRTAVILGLVLAVAASLLAAFSVATPSIRQEEAPLFADLDRACTVLSESFLCVAFARYDASGVLRARSDWIVLREPMVFDLQEHNQGILEFNAGTARPGFSSPGEIHWTVVLESPAERPLMRGLYGGVHRADFLGFDDDPNPGLNVTLDGPSDWQPDAVQGDRPPIHRCDGEVGGRFKIDRLTWSEDWRPDQLAADFERVCTTNQGIWVIVGRLKFQRRAAGEVR